MPKFARGGFRILGVLALAAILTPSVATLASDAGRNFSRCVQRCNDVRRACNDACTPTCTAMFPSDAAARNACISTCKADCDLASDECKAVCLAEKNGECPTEP